jgi:hypothetical protein
VQPYTVRWMPSSSQGVQGYVLSLGTASGAYQAAREVSISVASATPGAGGTLTYTIQLDRARDQFLAMRAFNANAFSVFSNEIRVAATTASSAAPTLASASTSTSTSASLQASGSAGSTSRAIAGGGATSSALAPGEADATDSETDAASGFASLDLNGEDEYLATTLAAPLDLAGGFSASLWAKAPQDGAGRRGLLQVACADQSCALEVSLVQGAGLMQVELRVFDGVGGTDEVREAPVAVTPDEWWHLAVVLDPAGSTRLYFDGEVVLDAADVRLPAGLIAAEHALALGATEAGRAAPWLGRLGHAAVFASALGAGEVAEISLYGHELDLRGDLGAYRSSDALAHYWRLGDDASAVGVDSGSAALDLDDPYGNVDGSDVVRDGPESLASGASVASSAQ